MNTKNKVVPFKRAGRVEKVFLHVHLYEFGMRLAIQIYCIGKLCIEEPYARLTINIPSAPFELKQNEAFIDMRYAGKEFLTFIRQNHLGTIVPGKTFNGFPLVAFNMDKLREFDPDGVEKVESDRREFWETISHLTGMHR